MMANIYSFETKEQTDAKKALEILETSSLDEKDYQLLVEMVERLKKENIEFRIADGPFEPKIFAGFSEVGNGSLRFAISVKKGRYNLEGYYNNDDEDPKPYIFHLISAKRLVLQTVINRIKQVAENLDEVHQYEGRMGYYLKVVNEMAQKRGIETFELSKEAQEEAIKIADEKKKRIEEISEKLGIE